MTFFLMQMLWLNLYLKIIIFTEEKLLQELHFYHKCIENNCFQNGKGVAGVVLLEQGNCLEADSLSSGNPHSPTASLNWRDEDDISGED